MVSLNLRLIFNAIITKINFFKLSERLKTKINEFYIEIKNN